MVGRGMHAFGFCALCPAAIRDIPFGAGVKTVAADSWVGRECLLSVKIQVASLPY